MGANDEKVRQDCWKVLTLGEKTLLFALITSLIFFLGLFVYIIHLQLYAKTKCETVECVRTAAQFLKCIDKTIDPCVDFERFACGGCQRVRPNLNQEINAFKLEILLETPTENSTLAIDSIRSFYQACLNETNQISTLSAMIETIGGWPLIEGQNWSEDGFNWLNFKVQLAENGFLYNWLLNFQLYTNDNNLNILQIGPPLVDHVSKMKMGEKWSNLEVKVNLAIDFGASEVFAWEEMEKVQNFELELFDIVINENQTGNIKTINEISQLWPNLDFLNVLNRIAHGFATFDTKTDVYIIENYVYNLNTLIQKTAKRTQANYLIWKLIENYLPFLSLEKQKPIDRSDICYQETQKWFSNGLETEFAKRLIKKTTFDSLIKMVNLIKGGSIDGEFKSPATDVTITGLSNYVNLAIPFESANILQMSNEVQFRANLRFFDCVNKNATYCRTIGPQTNDAYFDPLLNTIVLSPNVLFAGFDANLPFYVNFGRIGWKMAQIFVQLQAENGNSTDLVANKSVDSAFVGYLRWIDVNGLDKSLVGLNYTNRQLFWMCLVQFLCGIRNREEIFDEIRNSYLFQNEFQCGP